MSSITANRSALLERVMSFERRPIVVDAGEAREQPLHHRELAPGDVERLRHRVEPVHPAGDLQHLAELVAELAELGSRKS